MLQLLNQFVNSPIGFMESMYADSTVAQEDMQQYDVKAAKKYLKKKGEGAETVHLMFRYNEKYCQNMTKKHYRTVAAICIVQKVTYEGCDVWNAGLKKAMEHFLPEKQETLQEVVESAEECQV